MEDPFSFERIGTLFIEGLTAGFVNGTTRTGHKDLNQEDTNILWLREYLFTHEQIELLHIQ